MTLGGLFSGIGGFELAAQWAGITPVWSNEIDSFCCKVLRKNFSHEIIESDIREIGTKREHELAPVDIICGGFPCQPFSTAGQRKGKEDDRYLWPEMLRTIREVKPTWVVGENVAGIVSMDGGAVFEEICTSLENEGYQTEAYIIPACAVGAPHRRDRIWIVAHASQRNEGRRRPGGVGGWIGEQKEVQCDVCDVADTNNLLQRGQTNGREFSGQAEAIEGTEQREEWNKQVGEWGGAMFGNGFEDSITAYSTKPRPQNRRSAPDGSTTKEPQRQNGLSHAAEQFNKHWLQVATRICRMDDGIPRGVDRSHRLKALGNAIVPQVAQILFESILQVEAANNAT